MNKETNNTEEASNPKLRNGTKKTRRFVGVAAIIFATIVIFVFLQTGYRDATSKKSTVGGNSTESQDFTYGGGFYRNDNKVFIDDPRNDSINNLELPDADPGSFLYLQGLAGYDKNNFYYLKHDNETRSYLPVSVPISSEIKQLFDLVESPGDDVKIVWNSDANVVFENVTFRMMSEFSNFNAFRIDIFEILNNGNTIGYLWTNGLSKTNITNGKLYLYTDSITTGFKRAVYEVSYGNQPEMILDIDPDKTTFRQGGSKIYYTKSFSSLDFYEYDTVTRTDRKIPVQYEGATTSSSGITVSPDEKYLLVQNRDEYVKTSTLLVDINTGSVEIVREKEDKKGGDFPFTISPSNDKVFFLKVPYEGYLFTTPFYVEKDDATGAWGNELNISSIRMEVGGGWEIDTGQWSTSPSGRYLAVADATENSTYSCFGQMGGTQRAHNVIKIFDLETLETQILIEKTPDVNFTLNSWLLDESGIFATKRKVEINPTRDCGDPKGEGVQELHLR